MRDGATVSDPSIRIAAERVRWALFRRYSDTVPYLTPLESGGLVGREFFHQWAKDHDANLVESGPTAGILPSPSALASDDFDPSKVDPMVARVYDAGKTLGYRACNIRWGSPLARVLHKVYHRLIARGMQQLSAAVDDGFLPTEINSHIDLITPAEGAHVPPFRAWTRTYDRDGEVFYTACAFPFRCNGPRGWQAYLCCVLPLSYANLAVVFHPENLPDGGSRMSTYREGSYCGGVYIVVPGKERFAVMPAAMKEHIDLRPRVGHSGPYVEGRHETWAFGMRSYTLSYELRPHPTADHAT